jgi:acyl carrier protein
VRSYLKGGTLTVNDGTLKQAWENILKVPVTADTDFFESGGHSLLAVELSIAIEEVTGVEPPPDLVYRLRKFGAYAAAPEFDKIGE